MCAPPRKRRGSVDHRPAPVEPAREQRGVLVLGRHRRAEPADLLEVARHRQRDQRPATAVGGVGDRPLLAFREPGQAGVLAAPDLLGVASGSGASSGSASNRQSVTPSALRATTQVRDAPQVLDPHQQDGVLAHRAAPGLNTELARYGSMGDRQDRVGGVALEQGGGIDVHGLHPRLAAASRLPADVEITGIVPAVRRVSRRPIDVGST